jgi:hypothetical protein
MLTLKNITTGKNHRGQCTLCNRKSFRWGEWKHVEDWHKNHKCINGLSTSKNGKRKQMKQILDNTETRK